MKMGLLQKSDAKNGQTRLDKPDHKITQHAQVTEETRERLRLRCRFTAPKPSGDRNGLLLF
jgi:hypothetical protein